MLGRLGMSSYRSNRCVHPVALWDGDLAAVDRVSQGCERNPCERVAHVWLSLVVQ